MGSGQTLDDLARQKRLLLVEADLRRAVLAVELDRAARPLQWLGQAGHQARRWRPVWLVAAPLLGFMLARRARGLGRWIELAVGAARILPQIAGFLHKSSPPARPGAGQPPSSSAGAAA